MGVLTLMYLICAMRTNLVLVGILFPLPFVFSFLTAAYWYNAEGRTELAARMQLAGAAFVFVTDMLGWYLFFALLLESIDAPFQLPGKLLLFCVELSISSVDVNSSRRSLPKSQGLQRAC